MQQVLFRNTLLLAIILFSALLPLHSESEFKLVEKWPFDVEILGGINTATVDSNNNLIAFFHGYGFYFVIKKDHIARFGPYGQGPSDISDVFALYNYKKGQIAIMEWLDKIKVFTFKKGTYVWKETKWLKKGLNRHTPRAALFYRNSLFVAGNCRMGQRSNYRCQRQPCGLFQGARLALRYQ